MRALFCFPFLCLAFVVISIVLILRLLRA
jgi:hypothetical protein